MMETRSHIQPKAAPPPSFTPVGGGVLQRTCACGGSPGIAGECDGCDKKKLTLQRSTQNAENGNANSGGVPQIVHEALNSPGQPLDAETRAFMEPRFGHDFSRVRVHTDARAAESASDVAAFAYTVGRDIVFARQNYSPNSAAGRKLLAHELTHVLQQAPDKNSSQRADVESQAEPISVRNVGVARLSRQGGGGSVPATAAARCRSLGVPCQVGIFNYSGSICRLMDCSRSGSFAPSVVSPGTCIYECRDGQVCVCVMVGSRSSAVCALKICTGFRQPSSERDYEPLVQEAIAAAQQQLGGQEGADGAQPENEPTMQAKLEISQPGDVFEQEADQVADRVLRLSDSGSLAPVESVSGNGTFQREDWRSQRPQAQRATTNSELATRNTKPEGPKAGGVLPIVHEVLRAPGQPLDAETRGFMETRFGQDFSQVRLHTDAQAAESAQEVNALAYTVGQDVVFGAGQFQPTTARGQRLLTHELTHTIQQGAAYSGLPARLEISKPENVAEQEADSLSALVAQGQGAAVAQKHGQGIARQEEAAATATATATAPAVTEDPGEKRARVAKELVDKLKAAKTTYQNENPRDWDNSAISDCSKFVQWVLEGAGEGELFGRESARTSAMRDVIGALTPAEQPSFRLTDPKVGDIMMWGGHVGIVYELVDKQGTTYLVFAHMGNSGARLLGKSGNGVYWLKASDTAKIDEMGSGAFLGFWTPP
ncbi:MAG: DUF4157 domain-containing protein [Pyrinomonadaceae bacterium]|nr:DUF4157 domain-containing protein [Pyrinomonadaceae bacterium]